MCMAQQAFCTADIATYTVLVAEAITIRKHFHTCITSSVGRQCCYREYWYIYSYIEYYCFFLSIRPPAYKTMVLYCTIFLELEIRVTSIQL